MYRDAYVLKGSGMSEKISVIGVQGRVAYTGMRGDRIPTDRAITVKLTPWIQRRLNDGDIKLAPKKAAVEDTPAKHLTAKPVRAEANEKGV